VTDWRYWITYEGKVRTEQPIEEAALMAAMFEHLLALDDESRSIKPTVEVEAIDNAGN
jgi:hypothetical protein